MRHGETDYNRRRLIQGRLDIPLNANGIQLAELTRDGFRRDGLTFDLAYCSPLCRARTTAEILLESTDTPIIYDDRICEMNFGEGEGVLIDDLKIKPELKNIDNLFSDPEKFRATEAGESYEALFARTENFLETEIYPKEEQCENILICCHGGIIRAFLLLAKKLQLKYFWDSHQPNCSVNILEMKDRTLRILEEHKVYYTLPKEKERTIL